MNRAGTSYAVAALTYAIADVLARFSKPQTGREEDLIAPYPATLARHDHPRQDAPAGASLLEEIPILFRGQRCGVARLNLRDTRHLVAREVTSTDGAVIRTAHSVPGQNDSDVIDRTAECFEYVMSRVREVCADLVPRTVRDWYDTHLSDAEMLSLIESGDMNLGSPAFEARRERIAGSGTPEQKRQLAAALRRGVAGIKMGRPPNKRAADPDALRRMLPTIDEVVKAAKGSDPDDTALTQFLKREAVATDVIKKLRQRVRAAKRPGLAVALVAAAVLGVTRDLARDAIRRLRRENDTKSRPHNP
jgi:hypothetical protein